MLTVIGGGVGLCIAAGALQGGSCFGMSEFIGDPVISPSLGALTAALLGAIGLVAGYFPARDAARLDPVVAMKL